MNQFDDDKGKKEYLQEKHYALLRELQSMCRELPLTYQQRLPNELLSNLANSLLDKTVFDIVRGLKDIQVMTENSLLASRLKFVNRQKAECQALKKKHDEDVKKLLECSRNSNGVNFLKTKHKKELEDLAKYQEEELDRLDMKIILELDQVVSDQQSTLDRAGVPGFVLSNKEVDIKLQMYLLKFILELIRRDEAGS